MSAYPPASLPQSMADFKEILAICPKFRILVVGRSGVGKSSLVKTIFSIDDLSEEKIDIQDRKAGTADITHEITSKGNPHFILHDSEGFEPGSTHGLKAVEEFLKDKCDEKLSLKDRLHAIWLCIETPRTGMRLMQTADEELLSLADKLNVAVIVVFTKYDLLHSEYLRKATKLKNPTDRNIVQTTADVNAENHLEQLIKNHPDFKHEYVTVSTKEKYFKCHSMLANVTDITEKSLLAGDSWFILAVAQRVNVKQKIKAAIEIGCKSYWKDVGASLLFKDKPLPNCLSRIHLDIITIWNFDDPNQLLQPRKPFQRDMVDLIQPFTTLSLSKVFQASPQTALCLEAYIVDLMLVLYGLFFSLPKQPTKSLTNENILKSLEVYKETKLKEVHKLIRGDAPSGIFATFNPHAHKKIESNIAELICKQLGMENLL
ncbi:hypothetical protein H0H87_002769 [Tephrocybe sp. NHM501043]|nr:hypothetical protein H0H87_002769 [Tephrocybe sp. NHM501043]